MPRSRLFCHVVFLGIMAVADSYRLSNAQVDVYGRRFSRSPLSSSQYWGKRIESQCLVMLVPIVSLGHTWLLLVIWVCWSDLENKISSGIWNWISIVLTEKQLPWVRSLQRRWQLWDLVHRPLVHLLQEGVYTYLFLISFNWNVLRYQVLSVGCLNLEMLQ